MCAVFAPGPITARMGKRPVVSDQDPALERYLKKEFEGGKSLQELQAESAPQRAVARPAPPESAARPAGARPPVETASRDLRRTKPTRVPLKT